MQFMSTAFEAGGTIPERNTCDGQNVSPPLTWVDVPQEAQSLAVICNDPDSSGGVWSHWVIYNIPPDKRELVEGIELSGQLPWGGCKDATILARSAMVES